MAQHPIMYQDDIVKSIKTLQKYLKKMKPTDDYVRGFKDAQEIMQEILGDAYDVLKHFLYCDDCAKQPATHFGRRYNGDKVCDKCLGLDAEFKRETEICSEHNAMLRKGHIC